MSSALAPKCLSSHHHPLPSRRLQPIQAKQQQRRAREPGLYEVRVISPPPRSLGIHSLPPNTQCGDLVTIHPPPSPSVASSDTEQDINRGDFVVQRVISKYRLEKGRYVKDHNRIDVQSASRLLLNLHLTHLMKRPADENTSGSNE